MDQTAAIAQQDALRSIRLFVNGLTQGLNDGSTVYQDASSVNNPGQYQILGKYGIATEGRTGTTSTAQGLQITPGLILLGFAAFMLLK